jgi:hypothetical protein
MVHVYDGALERSAGYMQVVGYTPFSRPEGANCSSQNRQRLEGDRMH